MKTPTLFSILEAHPTLDAAFWRFCELPENPWLNARDIASDIAEAWLDGSFDAERFVREIEEERAFILSKLA